MKVEFIEPFVGSVFKVIETVTGDTPSRGQLALRQATFTTQQVSIMAGVNGEVEGTVLYGMSTQTALKIAGAMMYMEVVEFDAMSLSALSELGNMVTGNAITSLSQNGYDVDITPPSVVRGVEVEVSTKPPALVVPVNTQFGCIEINVSLVENAMKQAA